MFFRLLTLWGSFWVPASLGLVEKEKYKGFSIFITDQSAETSGFFFKDGSTFSGVGDNAVVLLATYGIQKALVLWHIHKSEIIWKNLNNHSTLEILPASSGFKTSTSRTCKHRYCFCHYIHFLSPKNVWSKFPFLFCSQYAENCVW